MDSRLDQWNIDSGIIMQIVLAADMNTGIVWADRTHTGKIVLANNPYCLYTHRCHAPNVFGTVDMEKVSR